MNLAIRGHIRCVKDGVTFFEDKNLIVDQALSVVIASLLDKSVTAAKSLFRCCVGSGGYVGTVRTVESDLWNTYTDLVMPIGSQDIDSQTVIWRPVPGILAIENEITVNADDYLVGPSVTIDEIGLVAGVPPVLPILPTGVTFVSIAPGEYLFAYKTITQQVLVAGESFKVYWNIYIGKEV